MRRTVKIPVDLPKEQMLNLLSVSADCFNTHVEWSFNCKSYNKNKAHKDLYSLLRKKYPNLPSGLIQSIRDMALESIKTNKFKFRPIKTKTSGIRFDKRCCSIRGNLLSISTLDKRERTLVKIPKYFKEIFDFWKFTGLQLVFKHSENRFYVCLNYEQKSPDIKSGKVLGIDRGLKNIVYCSNGHKISGRKRNEIKRKRAFQRKALQAKGTRSSKRKLCKLRGREKRFSLNENHVISKEIVNLPYQTFVLEKLTKIGRKKKGKHMNRKISNWSYYQLEILLEYKSEAQGKSVKYVDARYTSQRCSSCGHIEKSNRTGDSFECKECRYREVADLNAAKNIRDLWLIAINPKIPKGQVEVNQPKALPSYARDRASLQACPVGS